MGVFGINRFSISNRVVWDLPDEVGESVARQFGCWTFDYTAQRAETWLCTPLVRCIISSHVLLSTVRVKKLLKTICSKMWGTILHAPVHNPSPLTRSHRYNRNRLPPTFFLVVPPPPSPRTCIRSLLDFHYYRLRSSQFHYAFQPPPLL